MSILSSCSANGARLELGEGSARAPLPGGTVKLDGQWAFVSGAGNDSDQRLLRVPGVWNSVENAIGIGTYSLAIGGLVPGSVYALQFKGINSRASIKIDEELIGTWSETGLDFRPRTYWFKASRPEAMLDVEVENREQATGGIWMPVAFGLAEDVEKASTRDRLFDILVLGSIFMMGIYHLAIFFYRSNDRAAFWFGLFCLVTGMKAGLSSEQILAFIFRPLAGGLGLRLSYASVIVLPIVFLAYLNSLFPRKRSRVPFFVLASFGAIELAVVAFSPVRFIPGIFVPYQGIIIVVCVYALSLLRAEVGFRTPGARLVLVGFLLLFASVINDILHDNKIIASFFSLNVGLFFFLFMQAFVMGKLFAQSFRQVSELNASLEQRVAVRTSELERLARVDPLTGLFNRRHLMRLLNEEWDRRMRLGSDFCVVMVDLDHFKEVNDRYGHSAGDAALTRLSGILTESLRRSDSVGRFGGEEFCLVLSGAGISDAMHLMEKIRKTVESTPLLTDPETVVRTISYGVAQASRHPSAERALEAADALMYRAKEQGRNRGCSDPLTASG